MINRLPQLTLAIARPRSSFLALGLGATLTLACASKREPSESRRARPSSSLVTTAPIALGPTTDASPKTHYSPQVIGPIPRDAKQLIVTLSKDWNNTSARAYRFERSESETWRPVGESFEVVLGHSGLAWGLGLHDSQASEDEPLKVEGDGKSPAGVFAVGALYGYDKVFDGNTQLPYQHVDKAWRCVYDSQSEHYNRVFDSKGVESDWKQAEQMRRRDELYRLVIAIDHNAILGGKPVAQGGSCIFFHVWRGPTAPTIGCTAMPLATMKALATWLDPAQSPVLVALPKAQYTALQETWQLPAL